MPLALISASMAQALAVMGGLGVLFGVGLYVASRVFHVHIDPRIEAVEGALPGANCGGCGFPGCVGLATAIVHGSAEVGTCPVCPAEDIAAIARIMGVQARKGAKKTAIVHCRGREVADRFRYDGPPTCASAALLIGGPKACPYGCLGFGDCAAACPFDAIRMRGGLPEVDEERCTSCGKCVEACPRALIDIQGLDMRVHVACRSRDKGAAVRSYCAVGCIGCMKCAKTCRFDAIHVTEFLAQIDYEKCTSCGECVAVCPTRAIVDYRAAPSESITKEAS